MNATAIVFEMDTHDKIAALVEAREVYNRATADLILSVELWMQQRREELERLEQLEKIPGFGAF